jgi:hypothetical protein
MFRFIILGFSFLAAFPVYATTPEGDHAFECALLLQSIPETMKQLTTTMTDAQAVLTLPHES